MLFLLDAEHDVERELLEEWVDSTRETSEAEDTNMSRLSLPILFGRKGRLVTGDLARHLDMDPGTQVIPLRVVWLPRESRRRSGPRLRDLVLGDPRHPRRFASKAILRLSPDRVRRIAGTSASIAELRSDFETLLSGEDGGSESIGDFAAFVVRRASVALDVAERRLRGNRYKVPRYVIDGLWASPGFNRSLEALAAELGKPVASLREKAQRYMKEMVARPNSFFIDWMAKIARFVVSLGYENEIVTNADDIERTRQLMRDYPTALLWTHKSHVDGLAVLSVLYDNDLPAPHSLGGINMAFTGAGALGRKSGVIFIRRTFQDNPVYKLVLKHYLGYLMQKRFPLSWAFEGTRSRVGKLMPPRFGLLKYAIEAAHETQASDLHFIPVSISYDLIGEVGDYAREQAGRKKRPESLRWFLGYLKRLRAPMGRVYLDFGEPVAIEGPTPAPDDVDLPKAAFEIAVRVNNMTPVTFPALACIALLAAAPRALTLDELRAAIIELVQWLYKRRIRMTDNFRRGHDAELAELAQIVLNRGLISAYDQGQEPVYSLDEDRSAIAGYYRNTVVHYFINKAIIELAWAGALDSPARQRVNVFWAETDRLRDLFKFEFFYSPSDEFREQLTAEISMYDPDWESALVERKDKARAMLANMRPLIAHASLLPYIEAYGIVAQVLSSLDPDAGIDEKECVAACLKLGQQRYLQRHISSQASIAKLLFTNGYRLFANYGLTGGGEPAVGAKRTEVAQEFEGLSERLDLIQSLAQPRRSTV